MLLLHLCPIFWLFFPPLSTFSTVTSPYDRDSCVDFSILKQGKFKGKVLNINSIRGLKNDLIRLKHCISIREKTYVDDCRHWDKLKKQIEWDSCHVIEFIDKKCKIKGCDSNNICVIKMQDDYCHYGKELCPKCYGFQKWIPYPNKEDD